MILSATGIILAGGRSNRFGTNKALALWQGKRLIEGVLEVMRSIFPTVLVAVKRTDDYRFLEAPGIRLVQDLTDEHHPLGGIYSGLVHAGTEYAFVTACDMPLLQPGLVEALWGICDGCQAAVPIWGGIPQPLCGFYATSCSEILAGMIEAERLSIQDLLGDIRVRFLEEATVSAIDPQGLSFVDIDTADDYLRVLAMRD